MTYPTKKLATYVLIIVLGTAITVGILGFPEHSNQFNLLALVATLIVLLWYAYDTHRIAEQTIESNLRPVILRSGWIESYKKIKTLQDIRGGEVVGLWFVNLKNITKDIEGFLVIENKKYKLLLGNEATQENLSKKEEDEIDVRLKINLLPKWGWLPPGGKLYATFDEKKYENTHEKNKIYLTYQDIEGNSYFTRENEIFSQSSGKI